MMKKLFIISLLFFLLNSLFSQTLELEKQYITQRFKKGELTSNDYFQVTKDWAAFMKKYGGYPELPYDTTKNEIKFEYVQTFDLQKKVIFNRVIEWAAINFGALSSVLHHKNYDDGKIIIKGWYYVVHKRNVSLFNWNKIDMKKCKQTYVFTIKDNRLKYTVEHLTYEIFSDAHTFLDGATTPIFVDVPLNWIYPISKYPKNQWKEYLDLLNQTKLEQERKITSLSDYIRNYNDDYNF